MADREGSLPPIEPIKFVPIKGSPVIVGRRDKAERIREAIVDLQLVIDGATQQPCESPRGSSVRCAALLHVSEEDGGR